MTGASAWTLSKSPPPILEGVVHLWRVDLDAPEPLSFACHALLDDQELRRAERFAASRQSRRFAVARGSLRSLLGAYLCADPRRLVFAYGDHGKPCLRQPQVDLHFNVSHSGSVALMAFGRGRDLGIDVERTHREVGWERVARRFFARPELEELMALCPQQRRSGFFRCWTHKEAYMKATGRGITLGLGNFAVRVDPSMPAQLLWVQAGQATDWSLSDVDPGPEMAAALCVAGDPVAIEHYELRELRE